MNFENVNPLNVRLNKISGNLLPMTDDNKVFSLTWRTYSVVLTLLEIIQISTMLPGMLSVPTSKALQDGTVPSVVLAEVLVLLTRMQIYRSLASHVVRKLNDILRVGDQAMERIVRSAVRKVETPLKYYWKAGCLIITVWISAKFFSVVFKKRFFFYEDYRVPVVISKQPFSTNILVLGNLLAIVCTVCMFVKKNALDVYMINILLLMGAQYRYTAMKLATLFREKIPQSQSGDETRKEYSDMNSQMKMEIKALCRQHGALVQITPILRKLFSMNTILIYLSNVFRFCFLCSMAITAIPRFDFFEIASIVTYMLGGAAQLYILCLCVHNLLEASTETTDEAFHEKWYQLEPSLKRTFLLMIMGNNLECKISALEMFSLTLPSFMTSFYHFVFMAIFLPLTIRLLRSITIDRQANTAWIFKTILNQAYSIALLLKRVK